MLSLKFARDRQSFFSLYKGTSLLITALSLAGFGILNFAPVALAHHAFGGKTPDNFFTGFLAGLAHPIIGLDHFAFVIASGFIAVGLTWGIGIPIAFVLGTIGGTAIHLQSVNLPAPEAVIAGSVVLFGILLAVRQQRAQLHWMKAAIIIPIAALAGIFHGYAYGEAVVGAKILPLVSYLAGFTLIQLAIALGAYGFAKKASGNWLRFCGLAIAAIGLAFLWTSVTG